MFRELASLTFKRENMNVPLLLESLKTGAVTKDVDFYLHKKINKCVSEIVWNSSGPSAILAAFFEGNFRVISQQELVFFKKVAGSMCTILNHIDLRDSFAQTANLFKNVGAALKKHSVAFGISQGIAPVVAVIQPKFPNVKGFEYHNHEGLPQIENANTTLPSSNTGPKGQAQARALAQRNEVHAVMGKVHPTNEEIRTIPSLNAETALETLPVDCFELQNDFGQVLETLAEKFNLKPPKKCGNQYCIFL